MTVTDRTAATEQEFRDRIAAFEAAPTPPEVREAAVVERIIDALYSVKWPDGEPKLHMARTHVRDLAVAAYRAAQDGGAEEAVLERVRHLVVDHGIRDDENGELFADRLDDVLRAALAPQAGDGDPQIDPRSPRGAYL